MINSMSTFETIFFSFIFESEDIGLIVVLYTILYILSRSWYDRAKNRSLYHSSAVQYTVTIETWKSCFLKKIDWKFREYDATNPGPIGNCT